MSGEAVQIEKQLRTIKIIALAMLVGAPIVYLIVGQMVSQNCEPKAGMEMMLYLLLVIALITPATAIPIEKVQVQAFKRSQQTEMQPINLFFTISIIKLAMTEAVFIYGLVAFILTGMFVNVLYFYPVGMVWSFVHWPRRHKYDQLLEKLEQP